MNPPKILRPAIMLPLSEIEDAAAVAVALGDTALVDKYQAMIQDYYCGYADCKWHRAGAPKGCPGHCAAGGRNGKA